MNAGSTTRGSRAFVAVGVCWFVAFNAAVLAGTSRSAATVLGLYGFVFAVIFGKAYALVPSYFDRQLHFPRAPLIHLPLAVVGVVGLFAGRLAPGDPLFDLLSRLDIATAQLFAVGALAWLAGVGIFVGTLGWSLRDNLTGAETGTAGANQHRRRVDRAANAVVPLVALYLVWGSLLPVLDAFDVRPDPFVLDLGPLSSDPVTVTLVPIGSAASHVLAAGAATLLLFGIGFRLLPRFLVGTPRTAPVVVALATGALAPLFLTIDFYGGALFTVGATLLAVAIGAYAVVVLELVVTSDRRRVGFPAIAAGAIFGLAVVALGWGMGVHGLDPTLAAAHYRLALGGFLGLTIVGVSFQFYPPAIGEAPGVGDRGATVVIAVLAAGFAIEAIGVGLGTVDPSSAAVVLDPALVRTVGAGLAVTGSLGYAWVVLSIFEQRR
ncbi:hypothetical protein Halru_2879 [Halovivax ruber XH-70]|uniref:Uncharacterized protein n=1 Tax=Halovivax ruber (strain DSM 18193 / JCM 13892 / XH-70) TaxID=797302 RepID=L0IFB3_HALRX|nr:hypothetical protein [Halovivax ruber]AGB17449.1 hypothetical protein Halru_2879 [Halovivax ruber XH-70]